MWQGSVFEAQRNIMRISPLFTVTPWDAFLASLHPKCVSDCGQIVDMHFNNLTHWWRTTMQWEDNYPDNYLDSYPDNEPDNYLIGMNHSDDYQIRLVNSTFKTRRRSC